MSLYLWQLITPTLFIQAIFSSNVFCFCRARGRPALDVSVEDIEYLRGMRFSWTKIAEILGISRSTLYRRLEEEGIECDRQYTVISDYDLDRVLESIKQAHPNDGERLLIGHLTRLGIVVPRARVRGSIHRVDPINTAVRRSVTIRRRVYCVEGPNSLWHIDGHHKLIRWRLVTHGGIDVFSRTVVYLHCSTNNRASTVMSRFTDAVSKYGVPDQVRTDLGGENVEVWQFMVAQHATSSAVLTGSSTHNERIERLWRDVYRCVSVLFHDLFRSMEDDGNLNCLNEVDMFCLHFTFLPRINQALESFVESWNNHPVSTCSNLTPNQVFIQGALRQNLLPTLPVPNPSPARTPVPGDRVEVPRSTFNICDDLEHELDHVDVLRACSDLGYGLYRRVCQIVGNHIQYCSDCNC